MKYDTYYEKQADSLYKLIMSSDQSWRKEWADEGFNQQNKENIPYKNNNQLMLFNSAFENNYPDPRWLTFNQIVKNGYKLEKGSKGEPIAFTTRTQQVLKKDDEGNPILEDGKKQYKTVFLDKPILKIYTVFNASKIQGIEPLKLLELSDTEKAKMKQQNYIDAEKMVKRFCENNGIAIKEIASDRAFFANGSNEKSIVVPLKSQFTNIDTYFATLFHEVAHSTKVLDIRINKNTDTEKGNTFGSVNYAKEELTAELTSLYLCKEFNIDSSDLANTKNNSMAYLKGWIENGTLNKEDLSIAMQEAQRATKEIYKEFLALKQENNLDNIKEIKLLFSESTTENNLSFKNLNELQNWFSDHYTKNKIPDYGYNKNFIEINQILNDGKENNLKFRIDVSIAEGDFNPKISNVKEYLANELKRNNIIDNSIQTEIKNNINFQEPYKVAHTKMSI